jgi:hypothetical protein
MATEASRHPSYRHSYDLSSRCAGLRILACQKLLRKRSEGEQHTILRQREVSGISGRCSKFVFVALRCEALELFEKYGRTP